MQRLQQVKNNPNDSQAIFQDPRMIQCMGVLMGIDMDMMGAAGMGGMGGEPGASGAGPREAEEDVPMPDARPASSKPEPPKPAPKEPTPEPEDDEAKEKAKAKAAAEEEKKLGTEQYKKKNFDARNPSPYHAPSFPQPFFALIPETKIISIIHLL